jgi:hypothetical protein
MDKEAFNQYSRIAEIVYENDVQKPVFLSIMKDRGIEPYKALAIWDQYINENPAIDIINTENENLSALKQKRNKSVETGQENEPEPLHIIVNKAEGN